MKKVSYKLVEKLARITRKFDKTGDIDLLDARVNVAKAIAQAVFGRDKYWISFCDLFDSICGVLSLKKCTNNEIIQVLRILDIEVDGSDENEQ